METNKAKEQQDAPAPVSAEKAQAILQSLLDAANGKREITPILLLNAAYVIEQGIAKAAPPVQQSPYGWIYLSSIGGEPSFTLGAENPWKPSAGAFPLYFRPAATDQNAVRDAARYRQIKSVAYVGIAPYPKPHEVWCLRLPNLNGIDDLDQTVDAMSASTTKKEG